MTHGHDEEGSASVGTRMVFNGPQADPMFHEEKVALPELAPGEILVQVRLASLCMSDVHTITGQRTEPTPRYVRVRLDRGDVRVFDISVCWATRP